MESLACYIHPDEWGTDMRSKPLPDILYLKECFDYNIVTGILIWKERPIEHFKTAAAWLCWNNIYPETRADVSLEGKDKPYRRVGMFGTRWKVHRVVWKLMTGDEPIQVDHINCDHTDNRWCNLRLATGEQNVMNQRGWRKKITPKGVIRIREDKWRAKIQVGNKQMNLGYFPTAEDAAKAYQEAAKIHHKEWANFGRN